MSLSDLIDFKYCGVLLPTSYPSCLFFCFFLTTIKFYLVILELYAMTHQSEESFINVPGQAPQSFSPFWFHMSDFQ